MYKFKITDEPFARGYLGIDSENRYARAGAGYREMAKSMPLAIDRNGMPDCRINGMAVGTHYDCGQWVLSDELRAKAEKNPDLAADYNYIDEKIGGDNRRFWSTVTLTERDIMDSSSGWGGTWGGHGVPDLIDIARYGTDALREKVSYYKEMNSDVAEFYDGLLYLLDGLDTIGDRLCALAESEMATADEERKTRLARVANTFKTCPRKPATTFTEAVHIYVMMYTLDGIDSPGHFDWYMIDFWNNTEYTEARAVLEDLWNFFYDTRSWNLCIGGSDENWNDKTNALTYEILDVCAKYKYNTPNITMRCHRNTPDALYRAAAKTIGVGTGMPTLYNDEAVCPALERMGIRPEHSHLYIMNGCNQIDIQGKSHMGLEDGEVNLGSAVAFAVLNGDYPRWEKRVGLATGEPEELDTFEKFFDAVKKQVKFICDVVCNMSNKAQRDYAKYTANPIRTLTIEGCIEKGKDYKDGGPLYGHGQILAEGVPDAIDSIAVIKKFVYDEKKYTLRQFSDALRANWVGFEEMRREIMAANIHFGNDNEYVDEIGRELVNFYNSYLMTKPTVRGGFFSGGCSPFNRAANNGRGVGPLPYGKRNEDTLYGDSIGAVPGNDVMGPTALMQSCLKFDHTLPTSGFILNVKFDKKLFNTEKGQEGFIALWKAYFEGKGQQLSATVVSREDLLDAKINPDEHKGLIVRVGGYSEYFVNLSEELQDNVIARTDYDL